MTAVVNGTSIRYHAVPSLATAPVRLPPLVNGKNKLTADTVLVFGAVPTVTVFVLPIDHVPVNVQMRTPRTFAAGSLEPKVNAAPSRSPPSTVLTTFAMRSAADLVKATR